MESIFSGANGSHWIFEDLQRLGLSLEVLTNLIFLAAHEAENPKLVCQYLELADEQINLMADLLGAGTSIADSGRIGATFPCKSEVRMRSEGKAKSGDP